MPVHYNDGINFTTVTKRYNIAFEFSMKYFGKAFEKTYLFKKKEKSSRRSKLTINIVFLSTRELVTRFLIAMQTQNNYDYHINHGKR